MIVSPRKNGVSPKRSVKSPAKAHHSPMKTIVSEKSKATSFALNDKTAKKIPFIPNANLYIELKLSGTNLISFEGMTSMASLEVLRIENSRIESFLGAKKQPSLEYFIIKGSPLALYEFCPIMSRIVFGTSLKFIGTHPISKEEKRTADHLSSLVYDWLVTGWLLTSVDPIRIYNPVTQARKKLFLNEDFLPITMQYAESSLKTLKPVPPAAPSTPSTASSKARDAEILKDIPEEKLIISEEEELLVKEEEEELLVKEEEEEGDNDIDNVLQQLIQSEDIKNKKSKEEENNQTNQDTDDYQELKELEKHDLGNHELDNLNENSNDLNDLLLNDDVIVQNDDHIQNDDDLNLLNDDSDLDWDIADNKILNQEEEDADLIDELLNNDNSDIF